MDQPTRPSLPQPGAASAGLYDSNSVLQKLNDQLSLSEGLTQRRQQYATSGPGGRIYDTLSDPNKVMTGIDPNANLKQGIDLRSGYTDSIAKAGTNTMDILTQIYNITAKKDQLAAEKLKAEEDKRQYDEQFALKKQQVDLEEKKYKADLAAKNMLIDPTTGDIRGMTPEESKKANTSTPAREELLSNIKSLIETNTKPITGAMQLGALIPGDPAQLTKTTYDQLKGMLSLDNVKLLKGQGAVSDSERRLLENASSKLSRNLSDEDFKKVLKDMYKGLTGEDAQVPGQAKTASDYWNTTK